MSELWGGRKFQIDPAKAPISAAINHLAGTQEKAIRKAEGDDYIVLQAEAGEWRVRAGNHVPRTFAPGDVSTALNEITDTAHEYETGDGPLQLTDGGGGLPAGLAESTDYWIVKVDANTIAFAASPGDANRIAQTGADNASVSDALRVGITTTGGAGPHTIGGTAGMTELAVDGTDTNGVLLDGVSSQPRLIVSAHVVTVKSFAAADDLAYWLV